MLTRTSDESALECEIRICAGEWWWATVNMFRIWTMGKVKSQIESEAVLSRCLVSRPSWKFQFQTHRFYWFLILESVSSTKACEWIICLVEGNSLYNWIHHTHLLVHVCHVFKCITIRITKICIFPWKYWISRECPDVFRYEVRLLSQRSGIPTAREALTGGVALSRSQRTQQSHKRDLFHKKKVTFKTSVEEKWPTSTVFAGLKESNDYI